MSEALAPPNQPVENPHDPDTVWSNLSDAAKEAIACFGPDIFSQETLWQSCAENDQERSKVMAEIMAAHILKNTSSFELLSRILDNPPPERDRHERNLGGMTKDELLHFDAQRKMIEANANPTNMTILKQPRLILKEEYRKFVK